MSDFDRQVAASWARVLTDGRLVSELVSDLLYDLQVEAYAAWFRLYDRLPAGLRRFVPRRLV